MNCKTTAFKPFPLLVAASLALPLAGCASEETGAPAVEPTTQAPEPEQAEQVGKADELPSDSKVLVAYFSRWENSVQTGDVDTMTSASVVVQGDEITGTTEYVADQVAAYTGGDLFQMRTSELYPEDFDETVDAAHEERDAPYLPPLQNTVDNLDQYDVVFLGFPIWSSTAPNAAASFLAENDLSGKTVVPFCTHDGYGQGSSFARVGELCPASTVLEGLAVPAAEVQSSQTDVVAWLESIGAPHVEESPSQQAGETPVSIDIGGTAIEGVLFDTPEARAFQAMMPCTISMVRYGDREYYGSIEGSIETDETGDLSFEDGAITYCPTNNTVAFFFSQSSNPDLTMGVIPIGRVTSDLAAFDAMGSRVEASFQN
ncbi:hypothetical protein C1878_00160 [Gordonibacter sp. 28C]|uniref:flavodoxin n=1 Tax=Gordonibacter sp. 28C TaxID=2078569 RepID=UPI000DF7B94A|nr:flavodoxin [Gordonibacter sp. 28C]RDB64319.1 hypothetical protein C1878_00160 [Gordonibacter sp. 28C]